MKLFFLFFLAMQISVLPALAGNSAAHPKIIALGDSLTAGYGLPPGEGFVAKLQKTISDLGISVEIVDAGVAGDTASQGLARLDWAVPNDAKAVLLELGANDALRGLDPSETEKALEAILTRLREREIPVLLMGMKAPPNLGSDYQQRFDGIFPRLAEKFEVSFYPFFLEGVAGNPSLNQDDGMHPNANGVDEIISRLQPFFVKWLKSNNIVNIAE